MSGFKLTWRLGPMLWLDDEKWADFYRLIRRHGDVADEVAFFISDDMYTDGTPLEDRQKQADVFARRARDVRALGATTGINVWPSFDLYAMEQEYYKNFRRMVDSDGNTVDTIACPVSDEFLAYIREKYIIFAKTKPDFIWVDDDCRFTHLDNAGYLCFCDECVKNFEGGKFSGREELVAALNKPENRDLRVRWSAYGADRLAKFCRVVRAAVDEVDPAIDTPFMTVGATHTTFSGDYIEKCMRALRSRRGRPGHFFWSDRRLDEQMWKMMEVGRQVAEYPEITEDILVEEESHPCSHLNKSFRARRNLISLALMAGCTGVAFNHLSFNEHVDRRLAREVDELHAFRPLWDKYEAFARGLRWGGMWPAHSWFMAAKMDCENGWFNEKDKHYDITVPDKLGPLGIAMTTDGAHASATLLAGKTIRCFEPDELEKVFGGNVFMDWEALMELEKMGHGDWAGVKLADAPYGGTCIATEHPFNGPFAGHGHISYNGMEPRKLIPLDDSVEQLAFVRRAYDAVGGYCCITKYENALGGKVIVDSYDPWNYVDDAHKLYLLSSIADWFEAPVRLRWEDPMCVSRIQPCIRTDGEKAALLLINASLDESYPVQALVRGNMTRAVLVHPDGGETELSCAREGDRLCVQVPPIGGWEIATIFVY